MSDEDLLNCLIAIDADLDKLLYWPKGHLWTAVAELVARLATEKVAPVPGSKEVKLLVAEGRSPTLGFQTLWCEPIDYWCDEMSAERRMLENTEGMIVTHSPAYIVATLAPVSIPTVVGTVEDKP